MSKPDDAAAGRGGDSSQADFESALGELEQIVADLEEGRLGLQEAMQRFEKGVGLLRDCYRILEQAEQKIEILTGFDADGNPTSEPFDASATYNKERPESGRRKTRKSKSSDAPSENDTSAECDESDPRKRLF